MRDLGFDLDSIDELKTIVGLTDVRNVSIHLGLIDKLRLVKF